MFMGMKYEVKRPFHTELEYDDGRLILSTNQRSFPVYRCEGFAHARRLLHIIEVWTPVYEKLKKVLQDMHKVPEVAEEEVKEGCTILSIESEVQEEARLCFLREGEGMVVEVHKEDRVVHKEDVPLDYASVQFIKTWTSIYDQVQKVIQ